MVVGSPANSAACACCLLVRGMREIDAKAGARSLTTFGRSEEGQAERLVCWDAWCVCVWKRGQCDAQLIRATIGMQSIKSSEGIGSLVGRASSWRANRELKASSSSPPHSVSCSVSSAIRCSSSAAETSRQAPAWGIRLIDKPHTHPRTPTHSAQVWSDVSGPCLVWCVDAAVAASPPASLPPSQQAAAVSER